MRIRYTGIATMLVVMAGCGPSETPSGAFVVVHDTVGTIPRTTSVGNPPSWELERQVRLGALDDPSQGFGRVTSVVLDDHANLYVADELDKRIAVFDSTGMFVRSLGREGAGPAEYERPYALGWLEDTLLVLDPRNARVGKFSMTGEWIGQLHWMSLFGPTIKLLEGSPTDLFVPVFYRTQSGGETAYLHVTPAGVRDTVRIPQRPEGVPSGPVCHYPNDGGTDFFGIPFGPEGHVAGGPGGTMYVGWPETYQIAQVTGTDTLRLIGRTRTAVPILDEEWDVRTERYRTMRAEHPGVDCNPDRQPRPDHKPAYRWFGLDRDGQLWVEAYTAGGFVFEVFDPDGVLIAWMPAPERDPQIYPYVGRDRLAVAVRDEMDVHYVEVYRIDRRLEASAS